MFNIDPSSRHLSRSLSKATNHCAGFSLHRLLWTGLDVQEDARLARIGPEGQC